MTFIDLHKPSNNCRNFFVKNIFEKFPISLNLTHFYKANSRENNSYSLNDVKMNSKLHYLRFVNLTCSCEKFICRVFSQLNQVEKKCLFQLFKVYFILFVHIRMKKVFSSSFSKKIIFFPLEEAKKFQQIVIQKV